MKNKRKFITGLALVLFGTILVSGCGKKEEADAEEEWVSDKIVAEKEEAAGEENFDTNIEISPNQGGKADIEKADLEEDKKTPGNTEDAGAETP